MQASSIMRWGESLTLAGTCQIDSCPKSLNTARKRAEDGLRQFADAFQACFNRPQFRHFVTVLVGLLQCLEPHTLTGVLRQVAGGPSVASLSRFLSQAPWSAEAVTQTWITRFQAQVEPLVTAEQARQRAAVPKRRGRPRRTEVVGYLIGDDSTMEKKKGRKMAGLGLHHSTTEGKRVKGHSLVLGMYLVLGRRCPLAPRLYRQRRVCASEEVPFASKVDLMLDLIRTFAPLPGTRTHVLLDSWYSAKRLWKTARQRGFLITTGVKKNRALCIEDPTAARGWRWQRLDAYAQQLPASAYQLLVWPSQASRPHMVYAHVVSTRVRTLYRCQIIIVRDSLETEPRFWASSDLRADLATLVQHIATRWTIEVLFSDAKDVLGMDQYQVMSATALVRFWTLVLAAYTFLDEERARLLEQRHEPVTLGDTRRALYQRHQEAVVGWICEQHDRGQPASAIAALLSA